MSRTIQFEDLKVGDVLFCAGSGWLSETIARLDGGPYSHAALYVGQSGDGRRIAEAGTKGVLYHDLADRVESEVHTDVYRWREGDGSELDPPDHPPEPILERAHDYVRAGTKYAYPELAFVAVLLIAKKIDVDRVTRWILAAALDEVNKLIEHGRHPVVCSEFVYRCYREAGKKYTIEVTESFLQAEALRGPPFRLAEEQVKRHLDPDGPRLGPILERWKHRADPVDEIRRAFAAVRSKLRPQPPVDPLPGPVPLFEDFVSPNSLAAASNLHLVGRLK